MKRAYTLLAIAIVVVIGAIMVKLTIPLTYAETPVYKEAADYVAGLQKKSALSAEQAATQYSLYRSDYQTEIPKRIKVTSKALDRDTVRITIFDPSCEDDSISSSIHRIYMRKDGTGKWRPIKSEFSQKGRGRFGWTTSPTL
ncbi:MAG: hypothetical protein WCH43_16195 [Verrucomicrobiota bacterium]